MLVLFISAYEVFFFFFYSSGTSSIIQSLIIIFSMTKKIKQRIIVKRLELNFQCLEIKQICLISGIANKNFGIYCVLHEICLLLSN